MACVCATDNFCCEQSWDQLCVEEVTSLGCGSCGGTGGSGGGPIGGSGGVGGGPIGGSGGIGGFGGGPIGGFGGSGGFGGGPVGGFGGSGGFGGGPIGGFGGSGGFGGGPIGGFGGTGGGPGFDCCQVHPTPGCIDPKITQCVCASDPYCCQQNWDSLCVEEVTTLGCGTCGGTGGTGGGGTGGIGGFGGGPIGGFGGFGGGPVGGFGGFGGTGGTPGFCGNGVPEPGEQCDDGPKNQDRPAFQLQQGAVSVAITPLDTFSSVQQFYGYSSASSHTGFEELMASRIILHRNLNGGQLSLIMHHGIDQNTSGQPQPSTQVKASITGLPVQTFVTVADDNLNEFNKSGSTAAVGAWQFVNNSDGGAISQLPIPGSWIVGISMGFSNGINDWAFVNGNSSFVALNQSQSVTLIAYDKPSTCRTDCTKPFCGDGILDGGEVCEPGLTPNCAPDCKSLINLPDPG